MSIKSPKLLCAALILLAGSVIPASGQSIDTIPPQAYVADQVLIRYRQDVRLSTQNRFLARGFKSLQRFNSVDVDHVQLPPDRSVAEALAELRSDPQVEYAEPVFYRYLTVVPNDPRLATQWWLNNSGQRVNGVVGASNADIDAERAWDITTGNATVVVAVVDSGIDLDHPDLQSNLWVNPGEVPSNGVDDDGNGYTDDVNGWNFLFNTANNNDFDGHGTHVSGIIGAIGNNGFGVVGVAWNVRIMALRFTLAGTGTTADEIRAIEYARNNGADIINMSFSGPFFSVFEKEAIDNSGALVVTAAGNSGSNNDVSPEYPASYSSANILAVASSNASDGLSGFSNFGPNSVDVAAPGENILSTWPMPIGASFLDGTSMSTPIVSGVAALLLSHKPGASTGRIITDIITTADVQPSMQGRMVSGGRVNAYRALMRVEPQAEQEESQAKFCFISTLFGD